MNVPILAKKIVNQAVNKLPALLTGAGITALITSVIFAVKATPTAMKIIEEMQENDPRRWELNDSETDFLPFELSKWEIIKKCTPVYIPTALMVIISAACMIGSTAISSKRLAMLASLYSVSEVALKEYQEKVTKIIGAKKEQKVRDDIHQDHLNQNPVSSNQVIVTGKGDSLCYDGYSGRYFQTDIEKVRRAQNTINRDIITDMWANVNNLYYELGLPAIKAGTDAGWDVDHMLEVRFSSLLADDGRPCLVIDYDVRPKNF